MLRVCQLLVAAAVAVTATQAHATTYYVNSSPSLGNDSNNGTSPSTPWLHLSKVNSTSFQPDDRILLVAGGIWNEQLSPKGSGTPGHLITMGMYGSGSRPIINGQGNLSGAVYLYNQHDWLIQDLEVTNIAPVGNASTVVGIKVRNNTGGLLSHVTIKNVVVHHVNGIIKGFYGKNAGIAVTADANLTSPSSGPNSYWADVTISNSVVYSVDRIGIYVGPESQDADAEADGWASLPKTSEVAVTDNVVDDAGADGILVFVVQNVMVANNIVSNCGARISGGCPVSFAYCNGASVAVWSAMSENATFQYNEVYNFMSPGDGEAFDADIGSLNSTFQYNYSHHNLNGMMLIFDQGGQYPSTSGMRVDGLKVRFNVSYAELNSSIVMIGGVNTGSTQAVINNNTIYMPSGRLPRMFAASGQMDGNVAIRNNIFSYAGAAPPTAYFELRNDVANNISFYANTYYIGTGGRPTDEPGLFATPPDSAKSVSDPMLVCPGSVGNGLASLDGMKLKPGSPALGTGANPDYSSIGSYDLWSNAVAAPTSAVNRGAYNGPGVALTVSPDLAFHAALIPSSTYEFSPWSAGYLVDSQTDTSAGRFGYSSALVNPDGSSRSGANHTESVVLDLRGRQAFDTIVLYPRNDAGNVGAGFPIDFTIEVWDGANWITRVTRTGYPQPGNSGQVFTWNLMDTTNLIRIAGTNLRQVGSDGYLMQLAEVKVLNSNRLVHAAATADSSYEADGWGAAHATDGLEASQPYSMGYSSGFANAGGQHTETLYLTTPCPQTYSSVTLFPRSDAGNVGAGFPVAFTIAFWNGAGWDVKVTQTGFAQPSTGQRFTWGSSYTTDKIRIQGTQLRQVQGSYLMQFAEVEAAP
jgi:hypothetical protein